MIKSKSEVFFEIAIAVFLGILAVTTLYPMLYVLFASVSDAGQLMRTTGLLLKPAGFQMEAYSVVFKNPDLGNGYRNTLTYLVLGTCISMFLTTLGAYALSKRTMFMRIITFFIVFTMWFPAGMIPFYLVVGESLGLKNTLFAMIIPRAIATYNLIVLRTGFMTVPESLEESARMDGANDFTILWKIYIPLCTANIAVVSLFYVVGTWNAWFDAMLFLNRRQLFPLQLLLREILIVNSSQGMMASAGISQGDQVGVAETIKYATIVIATFPILCVYPFIQKYFVKGVMIGAVKG